MIQLQVLNHIINKRDSSILLLNNLTKDYFSDYPNEYTFIQHHLTEYGCLPDQVTFLNTFPDFEVLEVNEPVNYLVDELYDDYNTRFLARTFNTVKKLLTEGKTDEAMKVYKNACDDMVKATHIDSVDIIQDVSRFDNYIDKCNDFNKYYIKTGFNELDDLIGGWDKFEEYGTVAARPGIGKSWVTLKMAEAAVAQGLRVGLYSGEMSEQKVGYRFDTLAGHISNSALLRGKVEVQANYKQYIDSIHDKYKGCLKVMTPKMVNGLAGVNALRAFIEKDNLDILFVDQHSLLEDDRGARNPVERAANISKDIKKLQVLKKIPIITVSQQNRSSTEDGVSTANISQSDRISQDSTVILFLEQKDNILTLNLVKSRDSVNNKKLHYAIDLDKGIFQFMPEEQVDKEACEQLRNEYEYTNTAGEDVF